MGELYALCIKKAVVKFLEEPSVKDFRSQSVCCNKAGYLILTMSSGGNPFVMFLLLWFSMIVVMMVPLAAPIIVRLYNLVRQQTNQRTALIRSGVFVAGYLVPWMMFGIVADLVLWAASFNEQLAQYQQESVGAVALIAGIYQFTPFKTTCLSCHQSKFKSFDQKLELKESFSMGIQYGSYCLGSCWGLMLVLLVLDAMSWVIMGLVTAIILAERIFHWKLPVRQITGLGLVGFGIWTTVRLILTIG